MSTATFPCSAPSCSLSCPSSSFSSGSSSTSWSTAGSCSPLILQSVPVTLAPSQIHLRPAKYSDLTQILAIYTHYILHTVANMMYTPPTLEYLEKLLVDVGNERLPFIVAVAEAGNSESNESGSDNNYDAAEGDLVLGFMYVTPFHPHAGMAVRSVVTSTYVHPGVRKGGIGGRLTVLMMNLLKNPERYTVGPALGLSDGDGWSKWMGSPASETAFLTTPTQPVPQPTAFPELLPSCTAFRGVPLRAVKTIVRLAVIDNEGIGKGKERFYTKFGFYKVGIIKGCCEKFGKVYDAQMWGMELDEWDEVEGRLKMKDESR